MTTPRPAVPRIPPLPEAEWDDVTRGLLDGSRVAAANNILTTLVRHRRLFRRWSPFAGVLLTGTLPARDRELVVLRTGWLCQSPYEWGQHVRLAREAGISDAEIRRVVDGPEAPGWSEHERALLRATDELHEDACITDGTWAELSAAYTVEQLIEVPMLVGQYHLVSFTLNSLGVQREPGVVGLPEVD
ncbi:MAG TPA: carboxymuconolactone decarboxylase family protein [Acidimicrobiales bacterium]|nr:carboxymuconolactone decarboxylase family protein [Acidimicrobiales bacterium]